MAKTVSSAACCVCEWAYLSREPWDHSVEPGTLESKPWFARAELSKILCRLRHDIRSQLHHNPPDDLFIVWGQIVTNRNVEENTRSRLYSAVHADTSCQAAAERTSARVMRSPRRSMLWVRERFSLSRLALPVYGLLPHFRVNVFESPFDHHFL